MEKAPTYNNVNWRDGAACLSEDPERFDTDGENVALKIARAKVICGQCAVRLQCLNNALDTNISFGVRGGENFSDRKLVRALKAERGRRAS